ncbi:MAG TPA: beta-galactosidase [Phycisphaerae bacterium]|nr:beta-galactosidase [Phycisphaerae bacterium]
MPNKSRIIRAVVSSAIALSACAFAQAPASQNTVGIDFAHPDRICYDSRSLIIEGKPFFLYSGAMHYFRCPKELWKDRLQKLKDAGLNCVETYLAWDVHEPDEPASPDDFSKLQKMDDISDFIQTARDLGLYVIIRPGPYICAEWDRGGLPGWLMKHKPEGVKEGQFLRANSPEMLAWDRHWIAAAAKVVKPHLITNLPAGAPGVILWQLENEYDLNGAGLSSKVRTDVLRTLSHATVDNGIDVPQFTCETEDKGFRADAFLRSHVYETRNRYPGFDMNSVIEGVEALSRYQPEKFRAITELQGGWFAQVGGKLSDQQGHNAAQINQLTLTAIESGVTSMNYYMFYGGSNLGYGAARDLIQSYDYNAPLREPGTMGDRYYAVKAIAGMLKEHGDQLIHSDPVALTITGDHADVSITLRRSKDGSQFYFIRNSRRSEGRSGMVDIEKKDGGAKQTLHYTLGNFGAKVLYLAPGVNALERGEWLPRPVEMAASASPIPAAVPVTVTSILPEEPTGKWLTLEDGKRLDSVNIFDQRYVHYRVSFDLTAEELKSPSTLRVVSEGSGKQLAARINDQEVADAANEGSADSIPLTNLAHAGRNTAEILFENAGCWNFGARFESEPGISQISVVPMAAQQEAIDDWRMKIITEKTTELREVAAEFDDHDWQSVRIDGEPTIGTPDTNAVFRGTLTVTNEQIAAGVPITFGAIDDSGTLYINGKKAGTSDDWSHSWTFDITKHLHAGKNIVAVVVRNTAGGGGLYKGCHLDPVGRPLSHLQVAPDTEVPANAAPVTGHRAFLSRYALEFKLPEQSGTAAMPWKLHLDADINAFVTLNGHLLGRYWAVGPQRDVWLPECWLKFGADSPNLITLQASPTKDEPASAVIKSVEVRPYTPAAN